MRSRAPRCGRSRMRSGRPVSVGLCMRGCLGSVCVRTLVGCVPCLQAAEEFLQQRPYSGIVDFTDARSRQQDEVRGRKFSGMETEVFPAKPLDPVAPDGIADILL